LPKKAGVKAPDRYAIVEIPADEIGSERPVRIGFVGFVDPRLVKPNSGFRAADPLKSFREIDSELTGKTDFIVVLWDLVRPRGDLKGTDIELLAKENEKIYCIITTEKRFVIYDPVQLDSAVILSSIERGRYIGLLSLGLDGSGQVESVRPDFFEMNDQVPEDAYLLSRQRKISKGNY
jgi:2',3'-cyclic-nucleotide 2'-phosphodiesterase (5'-nucleotidase family)